MVQFIDPRAPTAVEDSPYQLAMDASSARTIGYLANGFPDSERFLEALAAEMASLLPAAAAHWNKGNASIPAPQAMLEEINASCQGVIAAYGH